MPKPTRKPRAAKPRKAIPPTPVPGLAEQVEDLKRRIKELEEKGKDKVVPVEPTPAPYPWDKWPVDKPWDDTMPWPWDQHPPWKPWTPSDDDPNWPKPYRPHYPPHYPPHKPYWHDIPMCYLVR